MTADCKTIYSSMLATQVLQIMDSTRINALSAVNAENELVDAWIWMTCCAQAWYNTSL